MSSGGILNPQEKETSMPINVLVTISVTKTNEQGEPTGEPLYTSKLPITAHTPGDFDEVTIPPMNKPFDVWVEAGQKDWLEFFAVTPETPSKQLKFMAS